MKILIYGINFWPEPTGIGRYTGEMANWLASNGHEVRVITAPPYYPSWQIQPGYSSLRYTRSEENGATIWRCPIWVPAQPTGLKRIVHLLSFAASSLPTVFQQVTWRPDVVWVAAPAFACTPSALLLSKLTGATSWLHVQDFEIDAAFDMGLLHGRKRRRIVSALEGWLMARFDVASSISHKMVGRLREKGVALAQALYFPNWVDTQDILPYVGVSPYREELGIGEDKVVALFSGTLAAKQGLHLLPDLAVQLAQLAPHVHIVICGDGVLKETLQTKTAQLDNVTMLPLQPKSRLNALLGMADIHLLPQDPACTDLVMPSKLSAMLASGRPVVSTVLAHTEIARVLTDSGVTVPPGNVASFASAVVALANDPERRATLGQAGRRYAETHLSIDGALSKFLECLTHEDARLENAMAAGEPGGHERPV